MAVKKGEYRPSASAKNDIRECSGTRTHIGYNCTNIGYTRNIENMGAYEVTGAPESRSPSQTTLTAQAPTVFYGQSVSLSTKVTSGSSSPIPQGTVSFMDD